MSAPDVSGRLSANGITLAYDSFGDAAAETILLIAGLGTQMIRWTETFCRALVDRGFRVVRFDNRDAGRSTAFTAHGAMDFATLSAALAEGRRPDLAYTLADMALDAVGLLDALSVRRAHVVGRSMGGMVAQILASEHPARVGSLTAIMSSTGNPDLPAAAPDAMALMMRPAPDPSLDAAGFVAQAVAVARRLAGRSDPLDEAAYRALVDAELSRGYVPDGFGRQLAAMVLAGDRRARLAAIRAPTLVVHGTEDPLFPLACGQDIADAIPGAAWLPIQGMGHDLSPSLHGPIADAIARTARRATLSVAGERPAIDPGRGA
ncbi:alpha/beta hydrolase [Methylobacterium sp. NMS12]|uniref:alpha/beta fold hydrolase n=1 Tax=Methylobacterium sp. NMS12 TaxID=3079766 RepID=UPI003F882E3F